MNEELRDEAVALLRDATGDWEDDAYWRSLTDALAPLLDRLTQERDRARAQVARVEAQVGEWERLGGDNPAAAGIGWNIRAALKGERP